MDTERLARHDAREAYKREYPIPYYRLVVCDNCQRGFDWHKYHPVLACPLCGQMLVEPGA
jgi:hypothetical protein